MKSLMTKTMAMAAMAVVAAGFASAQTLKAEIPFQFRAAGALLAPGRYEVTAQIVSGGNPLFRVENVDTGKAIMLMPVNSADPVKAWKENGKPLLAFDCAEEKCELAAAYKGEGAAYKFYRPKSGAQWSAGLRTIEMQAVKAD